eukprot:scaffold57877_cov41-Cyclotella_meneghiniana.AAC.6
MLGGSGGSCVGGTAMVGVGGASDGGARGVGRRRCGGWQDSKMAIGSSFHVKITKITNCMRSQITNRGSQNFL